MSQHVKYALGLFALVFLIYGLTAFNVTVSNDSCTNIEQIAAGDIFKRSAHFGFNFLGVISHKAASAIGISNPVTSTQAMLAFFAAAGAVALFLFVLRQANSLHTALLSALIYAFSSNVWRFSLQSEYLILVPSLGLIACAFWMYNRWFLGSMFFALALLTSPFALFILPFAYPTITNISRKQIALGLAGFMLCYGGVSLFTYQETINGEWSYNLVYSYYEKSILSIKPMRVLAIWLYGYLRSFHVLLPFVITAVWMAFRSDRKWFYMFVLGLVMHLPAAIPEIRYGAYQMTFYPYLAYMLSGFVVHTKQTTQRVLYAALAGYILFNGYIVLAERSFQHQLASTYIQMQNDSAIPDSATVLMYQATKPLNTVYAPRLKGVAIFSAYQEKLTDNLERFELPDYKKIGEQQQSVYLIESGTSMPDDNLKLLVSGFVKNQGAKLKGFGLEKSRAMYPDAEFMLLSGYSLPVYKLTQRKH
jgi:hypothetical protein